MSDAGVTIDPTVATIVRPATAVLADVLVVDRAPRLDEPLRLATEALRRASEPSELVAAVRSMYRKVGLDPTKTRPSSEALRRRVQKGGELPRVNSLVDVINWTSAETQLPFGLYDLDRIDGAITLRLGLAGEEYPGIRKDVVHLAGRLTLADAIGPFGNPTADSARTMVTTATTRALVVVFVPADVAAALGTRAVELTRARVVEFCRPGG